MTITVRDIRAFKERRERFAMLTAYDAASARLLDAAGIPVLLVGDTLGETVLGHPNTLPVTVPAGPAAQLSKRKEATRVFQSSAPFE